jgi:DNA-nicking Smr family endonuclease
MRRRELSTEDLKIWRQVTRSVAPLHGTVAEAVRHPTEDEEPAPRARPVPQEDPPTPPVHRPSAPLKFGALIDMDRRTAQRFKRGEMAVDGRIDLHGMTLDQAHGALMSYMRGAAARGARCVIVVTGKGKDGVGRIRAEVPHWLNQQPLRALILAVTTARVQHGGSGALYVMLKRKR